MNETVGRKDFLTVGGSFAAFGFVSLLSAGTILRESTGSAGDILITTKGNVPMAELRKAHFAPHIGEGFRVIADDDVSFDAVLDEAVGKETPEIETFTLLFSGPKERELQQGTYHIRHRDVGNHDIFLVPVSATEGKIQYEAVFTRLKA